MPYRRPSGGGDPVAQTEAADTSADPVTVTLPALAGLEDGYIVRVYDSGSNATANNITINDADDAEVDVIDEDDGERYLVVVGGAWEVRGYLPQGGAPAEVSMLAALYALATAAGAVNTIPQFVDGEVLMPTTEGDSWVVSRNADRYIELIFRVPNTAAPGATALAMLGSNGGANALGAVRGTGTGAVYYAHYNATTLLKDLALFTDWQDKTVYLGLFYDHSAARTYYWHRASGGAEVTTDAAYANSGSGAADLVYIGGNKTNYTSVPGMSGIFAANYTADPGDAHRSAMYAALGL